MTDQLQAAVNGSAACMPIQVLLQAEAEFRDAMGNFQVDGPGPAA